MGKPRDWSAVEFAQPKHEFAGTITPLKMSRDRRRAEWIRDVVDAYRRLNESVCRFIAMLSMPAPGVAGADAPAGARAVSFPMLLDTLEARAVAMSFDGLVELQLVIGEARLAERYRDVIFAPLVIATEAELRRAAAALDRLDAAFVGLCVGHVLAQRAQYVRRAPHAASGALQ